MQTMGDKSVTVLFTLQVHGNGDSTKFGTNCRVKNGGKLRLLSHKGPFLDLLSLFDIHGYAVCKQIEMLLSVLSVSHG